MNVMQHLLVHLPWEAKVGGPVQFRWMYGPKRELKKLRATVRNKARVEGCIAAAFAAKEISQFSSLYSSRKRKLSARAERYHDAAEEPTSEAISDLKIFQSKGKPVGSYTAHRVDQKELNLAMLYLYSNMEEVDKYFK
jgi:hypothetical protein